jgi:hypothetical protein
MPVNTEEAAAKVASARQVNDVDHREDCPKTIGRTEEYENIRPKDGQIMTITRCQDCGNQRVTPTGRFTRSQEEKATNG